MFQTPTCGVLFEQQIAEAIIEVVRAMPDDSRLRSSINHTVAFHFGLDLEENPDAGFEKFTFRPLECSEVFLPRTSGKRKREEDELPEAFLSYEDELAQA